MRASLRIDPQRVIGALPKRLFGHLLARRLGVAEEGLHDPSHPTADAHGIRQDIEQLIRGLEPSVFRWPGGCTGTSYHWLDGVGPVDRRPRNIDLHFGWETGYRFGTNEFIAWCRRMGAEPLMNWNMGTGTLDEAVAWLEYCNRTGGTHYAELRKQHGVEEPHRVRLWQLGNETYGNWEIGHTTAEHYAEVAREWAKAARTVDPSIEIVAQAGALTHNLDWAATVIPSLAPHVDFLTFHAFWRKTVGSRGMPPACDPSIKGDDPWYFVLAGPHLAEAYIRSLQGLIASARRDLARTRPMKVAITEWNTADFAVHMADNPSLATFQPYYDLRDALANASFLNILLRESRTVTLATSAQALNVRGHVMANDRGVWREPIYWPLQMIARLMAPVVLDTWADSAGFTAPEYRLDNLQTLDAAATLDPDRKRLVLSLVNRNRDQPLEVRLSLHDARINARARVTLLHHDDPSAMNGPDQPDNVHPTASEMTLNAPAPVYELPPHSHAVVELTLD